MCENIDNLITQEETKPRFWTQLPNLIFEMGLSAKAIALYAAIKRSAGSSDGGQCTRSTRTLARNAGMSVNSVVRAKRELDGLGLIRIKEVTKGRGRKAHHITIPAIWRVNNAFFDREDRLSVSPGCKGGLDAGGNLVEFEVVKDDTAQTVSYVSSIMVLLVPQMVRSNNQRRKTNKKNQQQHSGEKNDASTGAAVVVADGSSFSLFSQNLPEPADGLSGSEADPGNGNNGASANRDALAGYGVEWTRDAQAVAARDVMTPALIHAWARHVRASPNVSNKPAYLVTVLKTVTQPPNERDNSQRPTRRRGADRRRRHAGSRESEWTEAELARARLKSAASCPLEVQYGCASTDEFFNLSDEEKKRREAGILQRVAAWAASQTGEQAEAITAAGGVYYDQGKFIPLTERG